MSSNNITLPILLILFLRPLSSGAPSFPALQLAQSLYSSCPVVAHRRCRRCCSPPPRHCRPPSARCWHCRRCWRHHLTRRRAPSPVLPFPALTMTGPRSLTTNCRRRCHRHQRRCRLRHAPPPSCCVARSSATRLPHVTPPLSHGIFYKRQKTKRRKSFFPPPHFFALIPKAF